VQRIGETELVKAGRQPLLVSPSTEAVDSHRGLANAFDTTEDSFALLCSDDIAEQAAEVADVLTFEGLLRDRRCVRS
jgi:hypothetical protein